ncbi:MAG: GNAT family N-acetyltransferase [Hyphomicrobiaceae bacterium]|nr:GNAT family N-acetyltransferase [Hyphomicrobiaceae bacterium]
MSGFVIDRGCGARLDASDRAAIDDIFFTASKTSSFPSAQARADFHDRWLGRYLRHDTDWFSVARTLDGDIAGYLAGAIDDPAAAPRFADIGYFAALAPVTVRFPAHLHVNVRADLRARGIGAALIGAFAADAAAAGAVGLHVVTGHDSRNVAFYMRHGFDPLVGLSWNGARILMLGRRLSRT